MMQKKDTTDINAMMEIQFCIEINAGSLTILILSILNELASNLIGNHDFLSFSKYRQELKNTCCEIFESRWVVENNMIIFKISGNRFLHHMIRYLVGTMVGVCQGRISKKEFKLLLNNPKKGCPNFKSTTPGSFLEKIKYD